MGGEISAVAVSLQGAMHKDWGRAVANAQEPQWQGYLADYCLQCASGSVSHMGPCLRMCVHGQRPVCALVSVCEHTGPVPVSVSGHG